MSSLFPPSVSHFVREMWPLCLELLHKDPKLNGSDFYLASSLRASSLRVPLQKHTGSGPGLSVTDIQQLAGKVGAHGATFTHATVRLHNAGLVEKVFLTHQDQERLFGSTRKGRKDFVALTPDGELRLKSFDDDVERLFYVLLREAGVPSIADDVRRIAAKLADRGAAITEAVRNLSAQLVDDRQHGLPERRERQPPD